MPDFRIAYGEIDITPPFPVDLVGYGARINPSLGVLDPLFATFLLLEGEGKKVLLLSFDLLAVGSALQEKLSHFLQKLGFREDEVFLIATHTHSAPATGALPYMGRHYEVWLEDVGRRIGDSLKQAMDEMVHRELKLGSGEADISLNRRTLEGWLPQKKEEGYVEREIAVLLCGDMPLLNFTCHAVCLTEKNRFVSADFPGRARLYLKYFLNAPAVLMANGAAGDQNPIERNIYGVEKTGRSLAEATLSALGKAERVKAQGIGYLHKKVSFPLSQPPSLEELEEFIARQKEGINDAALPEQIIRRSYIRWAEDTREKIMKGTYKRQVEGKISLLRIGDMTFLFLPGEVFSEIGKKAREIIKRKGMFPFIVGYYDKLVGYIPTASAFEEGGYEVSDAYRWYGQPAPFLPTVEDIVLDTVRELSERI